MASGYLRVSREASGGPGNETNAPTLATKKTFIPVTSFSPDPGTNHMEREDELRNTQVNPSVLPESYGPSWELSTRAYPDVLAQLLTCLLGPPTTTAGDGVITDLASVTIPVGATRHRWTDTPVAGANPATSQFDAAYTMLTTPVYWKVKGAAVAELSIETPEEGGAVISASGVAAYADEQSNPALTPAYETLSIRPFTRSNLTLPTNLAGTGETEDFSISISSPVEAHRSLGIASRWPDTVEYADEGAVITSGTIPKRILDSTDIAALKSATGFALLASWVSDSIITGAYPYKFLVSIANAQYTSGKPGELGNKRRVGMDDLGWVSTSTDGTTATTFEVVNATASYA